MRTDGRTDGHGDSSTPVYFFAGGINMLNLTKTYHNGQFFTYDWSRDKKGPLSL